LLVWSGNPTLEIEMKILYVGDLHGKVSAFSRVDTVAKSMGADVIVQVGDNAVFWPGTDAVERYFNKRQRQNKLTIPWYLADGNHEHHNRLDQIWEEQGHPDVVQLFENVYHVRRGGFVEIAGVSHVFCGGARSTDRHNRVENVSWWSQEAPDGMELRKFFDAIQEHKPEVVVTHDAPNCVPLYRSGRQTDPTAQGFMQIVNMSNHRPQRWYFGHHHVLKSWTNVSDVDFYCCGIDGAFHVWDTEADSEE